MRKMDYNGLILCKLQASLFSDYRDLTPCSPNVFIRRFMFSHLAERFDDLLILIESSSNQTFVEDINNQYGETKYGCNVSFNKEVLYWVGYVYRYWCFIYEIPSSKLYQYVSPKMLIDRYPLYHSMDIEYVIERIIEEEKLEIPLKKSLDDILKEYIDYIDSLNK